VSRITRKKLKQDEFVSTVDQIFQVVGPYWKHAVGALAAIAVVILLWRVAANFSGSRAEAAAAMLNEAMTTYEELMADGGTDLSEVRAQLENVIAEYGGTDQADIARLHVARIDLQEGETESARTALMKLASSREGDTIGSLATLDLIRLRVASGEGVEVASELQVMVTGRNKDLPRDTALYHLGEVYREEQNADQARTTFQTLVDEFPDSPYTRLARQRLSELG
jgi:predicted negative regulator of RcsB-dependent stress response